MTMLNPDLVKQLLRPLELFLWSEMAVDLVITAITSYNFWKMKKGFNQKLAFSDTSQRF